MQSADLSSASCNGVEPELLVVRRALKEELLKPRYRENDVSTSIETVLTESGLASELYNSVHLQAHHFPTPCARSTPSRSSSDARARV